MPGPLSQDLRDRLTAAVAAGSSARAAAERFGVSESTAIRWAQRWRAEGEARARPMGGDHRSRLSGHREAVLTLVAHQSDLTLAAQAAATRHLRGRGRLIQEDQVLGIQGGLSDDEPPARGSDVRPPLLGGVQTFF